MKILKKISDNILYIFLLLAFTLFIIRNSLGIRSFTDIHIFLFSMDICILLDCLVHIFSKKGNKFLSAMALGVTLSINSTLLGILDLKILGCVMGVGMVVALFERKRDNMSS